MVVVDELEKKAIEEIKKLEPEVKEAIAKVVDGRTFGCWGWSVRIYRTPKSQTPPTPAATETTDNTSATHSAPASV